MENRLKLTIYLLSYVFIHINENSKSIKFTEPCIPINEKQKTAALNKTEKTDKT